MKVTKNLSRVEQNPRGSKIKSGHKNFIISKLLPVGSCINCVDSSGAKVLKIIGYKGVQGASRRYPAGGVGSVCLVTVQKGPQSLKKKWHYALIVRQKTPILRKTGPLLGRVRFEDNAAVLLEKEGTKPNYRYKVNKVTVKGPIARQIYQISRRFDSISGLVR